MTAMLFIEGLSYFSSIFPPIHPLFFSALALAIIILTLYDLEIGLYLLLAELFIGGGGKLFAVDINGISVTIRMVLFFAVFFGWLGEQLENMPRILRFTRKRDVLTISYMVLGTMVVISVLYGIIANNYSNVYQDANAWLFFLLLGPFIDILREKRTIDTVLMILFASVLWMSAKTLAFFYMFSHNYATVGEGIYTWIRDTRMGEVTNLGGGIFRIFFQSHVYSAIALVILLGLIMHGGRRRLSWAIFLSVSLYAAMLNVTLSMSRSLWIGALASIFFLLILGVLKYPKAVRISAVIGVLFSAILLSQISLIRLVSGNFEYNPFIARSQNAVMEPGGSSRKNQFWPIMKEILEHPIAGSGFGETVTYISDDPRIRSKQPDGKYTTHAFELGYLGLWLKIGLIGLGAYLVVLLTLCNKLVSGKNIIRISFGCGLIGLMVTHAFSPYLDHPLGIGFVLLSTAVIFANYRENTQQKTEFL